MGNAVAGGLMCAKRRHVRQMAAELKSPVLQAFRGVKTMSAKFFVTHTLA